MEGRLLDMIAEIIEKDEQKNIKNIMNGINTFLNIAYLHQTKQIEKPPTVLFMADDGTRAAYILALSRGSGPNCKCSHKRG